VEKSQPSCDSLVHRENPGSTPVNQTTCQSICEWAVFFGLAFVGKSPARPEPIELREPFFDIDVSHRLKLLN